MVGNWLDKLDQSERKHNPRSLGLIFGKRHYGQNEASIVIRSSEPCFSRAHNSQIYLLSIASFAIVVKSLSHNGLHSISPCFATSRGHRSVRLTVRSSFLRCSPLLLSYWTRRSRWSFTIFFVIPIFVKFWLDQLPVPGLQYTSSDTKRRRVACIRANLTRSHVYTWPKVLLSIHLTREQNPCRI